MGKVSTDTLLWSNAELAREVRHGTERCPRCSGAGRVGCGFADCDGCERDHGIECPDCRGRGIVRMRRAENLIRKLLLSVHISAPVNKEAEAFLAWAEREHFPDYPLGASCPECGHEEHAGGLCGAPTGERPNYETCICAGEVNHGDAGDD